MDNAGENKLLEQGQRKAKTGSWAGRLSMYSPWNDHLADLGFTTKGYKGFALLVCANVPWNYYFRLHREAFKTAMDWDRLMKVTVNGKHAAQYQHMLGSNPHCTKHLRVVGEVGMVSLATGMTQTSQLWSAVFDGGYRDNHDGEI